MDTVLIIHVVGAPIGFTILSFLYFRQARTLGPAAVALIFLGTVVALDAGIVAPVIERSYGMFRSPLGTWLPFLLIFLATLVTGRFTRQRVSAVRGETRQIG
jgi:cell division protein FtsX